MTSPVPPTREEVTFARTSINAARISLGGELGPLWATADSGFSTFMELHCASKCGNGIGCVEPATTRSRRAWCMPNITPNVLLGAVAKLLAVVLIVGVVNACDGSTSGDSSDP